MLNGLLYNVGLYNGRDADALSTLTTYPAGAAWHIEVRDSSDTLAGYVDGWYDATWSARVDAIDTFEFSLPLTHTLLDASLLLPPYQIWIRDGAGTLRARFDIKRRTRRVERGNKSATIYCEGLLSRLLNHTVESYSATSTSIKTIAKALIDTQTDIGFGGVEDPAASQSVSFDIKNKSILESLRQLFKLSETSGFLSVSPSGLVTWKKYTDAAPDYIVSLGANMRDYEEIEDYTEIKNRIYGEGGLDTNGDKVVIASPGYVNDATSESAYGVNAMWIKDDNIKTVAQLTDRCDRELRIRKDPKVTRRCGSILVGQLQPNPLSLAARAGDELNIGDLVRAIPDAEISGAFTAHVMSFRKNLDSPLDGVFEIGEAPARDLADVIGGGGGGSYAGGDSTDYGDTFIDDLDYIYDQLDSIAQDIFVTAASVAGLSTSVTAPQLGYVTEGAEQGYYGWDGSEWSTLGSSGVVEVADMTEADATSGRLFYIADSGILYYRTGNIDSGDVYPVASYVPASS